jgi:UDP-GlcNAc:undecaprenyl-phosphate GlcNAc-1-phosphate transferase
MIAFALVTLAASVYLVYVLEILKFRRIRARQLRKSDPDKPEWEIDARVARDIETGEFEAVDAPRPPPETGGGTDEIPVVR